MNEIELLKARVIALENENQQLKALLRDAGINCSDIDSPKEQNQGERIIPEAITQNHPRLFFSYFWGRLDVYSKRFQNKTTGKAGYFPPDQRYRRARLLRNIRKLRNQRASVDTQKNAFRNDRKKPDRYRI